MLARPLLGMFICFSTLVFAESSVVVPVTIPHSESNLLDTAFDIVLPKVNITPILKLNIQNRFKPFDTEKDNNLPARFELGMGNVPVLNQGRNGSCVTFAEIAVIDTFKAQGDYYSELCLLNLGSYLQSQGFGVSGWNGIDFKSNFHRITEFGLVPKKVQKDKGCAGDKNYPMNGNYKINTMSLEEYHEKSEPIFNRILVDVKNFYRVSSNIFSDTAMDTILKRTKKHIAMGKRVLIGMYMPANSTLSLDANYKKEHDTWVLTEKLKNQILNDNNFWDQIVGHAMVITGYDDEVIVTDKQGACHYGVFKLRNSWGKYAGDHGDYYVTYDYFKTFVGELWIVT
jgi:C1A family cysteine protease